MTPLLLTQIAQALEACAAALRAVPSVAPPAPATLAVPTLLTVTQLCKKHPALRPNTVYQWLAAREMNGLQTAVIHLPNSERILLDEAAVFAWLEQYREKPRQIEMPRRKRNAPPLRFAEVKDRREVSER